MFELDADKNGHAYIIVRCKINEDLANKILEVFLNSAKQKGLILTQSEVNKDIYKIEIKS